MAVSLLMVVSLPVLLILGSRGAMGFGIPDVLQSTGSSSSSSVMQDGMLSHFLYQWMSITSNRFVLNMVQAHHFQLMSCPPLFHYFKWFNIKAAAVHHPIIQKEVEELLVKGAKEISSGGAGFYFNVFVVLSVLVVSGPYLTLSGLIIICTSLLFNMHTIRHV